MAITHVNTTTAVGAGTGNITINVPASMQDGDVMYAFLCHADDSPTVTLDTAPGSWAVVDTKIGNNTAVSNARFWLYRKVVTNAAGEPGSYAWGWDLTGSFCGGITAYRGVDNTTPEDIATVTQANQGVTTSCVSPTATTVTDDAQVVRVGIKDGDQGTMDGPTVERADIAGTTTGDAGCRMAWADQVQATAGSTGTDTWTITSNECDGFTFAIRPGATSTSEQEGFQWRADDGSESGASDWDGLAQDVDAEAAIQETIRLRVLSDYTGDPATAQATLQFKLDTDAATEWRDV